MYDEGGVCDDENLDREALLEAGLDPDDPDYTELAPHGMTGEDDDDGWPSDYDEDNGRDVHDDGD